MNTIVTHGTAVMSETAPVLRRKKGSIAQRLSAKIGEWLLLRTMKRAGVEVQGCQRRQFGLPTFSKSEGARIVIGGGCSWGRPATLAARGSALLVVAPDGFLNGCTITANMGVAIGPHCKIASGVVIDDGCYHAVSPDRPARDSAIAIGRNVWINPGARIGPGVTIGDHSVIGAGAVVTRDIPARSFAAGVPARVISTFECPDNWVRE